MTTIGSHHTGVTLNSSDRTVTITGKLTGDSPVNNISYYDSLAGQTIKLDFYAALQGKAAVAFDIVNRGDINSPGTQALDTGIFLAAVGTIINHGTIEGATGVEIFGTSGTAYIDNTALLVGRTRDGADLRANARLVNTGTIRGAEDGLYLQAGGTIVNAGLITAGTDIVVSGGLGTVINTGKLVATYVDGIDLAAGGLVANSGTIAGWVTMGAAATVTNSGDITGAVVAGSAFVNITNAAHGTIGTIGRFSGVDIDNGYVDNAGLISGDGAYLGGFQNTNAVTLANTGTIWSNDRDADQNVGLYSRGAVILTNSGTIGGGAEGIDIQGRVDITNTGTIAGVYHDGIAIEAGSGTIYNAGLIEGYGGNFGGAIAIGLGAGTGSESLLIIAPTSTIIGKAGVSGELSLAAGAGAISFAQFDFFETLSLSGGADWRISGTITDKSTIDNAGTLNAGDAGITLSRGGYVSNSGSITGAAGLDIGASLYDIPNDVYNSGLITATGQGKAALSMGLSQDISSETDRFYNAASGTLAGANGIVLYAGTVTNLGIIEASGDAIDFTAHKSGNRVILGPSAVTRGTIQLAGGSLDLQSGAAIGTLVSPILGAGAITLNSHAHWDFAGTLAAGKLVNNGTIGHAGGGELIINAPLSGAGTVEIGATLITNGYDSATQIFDFSQPHDSLVLQDPSGFEAKIEGFALGDVISLAGVSLANITATHFIAGILTLSEASLSFEFTFSDPASFGTDTVALSGSTFGTFITLAAAALPASLLSPRPSLTPFVTFSG